MTNCKVRLIARLDVKGDNLIKGVHLEGLRIIGKPEEYARKYYEDGADEIIYMDIVASLYGRSNLVDIVRRTARNVFIPMTVGGGVRTVEDVGLLLRAGADKVAINTAAVKNPMLIKEVADTYGSQCMVLSVESKKKHDGTWEVYTDCGREPTGLDVLEWVEVGIANGAGEILLTSIDREGTRKGFECDLVAAVSNAVDVPVITSGGYGIPSHLVEVVSSGADAVAFADALHYQKFTLNELRNIATKANIIVRNQH